MTDDSTYKIIVQPLKEWKVMPYEKIKVIRQGSEYIDTIYMRQKVETHVRRINKTQYINLLTGEVKEYKTMDKEAQKNSRRVCLNRAMAELRRLIRTNFTSESDNQLFLTLTYAENMQDHKRLYSDFKDFIKRLRYNYPKHNFEYISVAEPQARGAWHMHVMLKTDQPILYIDNRELEEIWGHGFTDAQKLHSSDVGTYYTAYFTNLVDETDEIEMHKGERNSSNTAIKKGGRLHFYPKGFKFYRCSRGIARPSIDSQFEFELDYEKGLMPVHQTTHKIVKNYDDNTPSEEMNVIQKTTYKRTKRELLERKKSIPDIPDILDECPWQPEPKSKIYSRELKPNKS